MNMIHFFKTRIGRLRILGIMEGLSLLILIGIAVPLKHFYHNPAMVKAVGPVHGAIFLLYMVNVMGAGVEYGWKFRTMTWKILLACFIPFGTFYVDYAILRKQQPVENQ